jgi:hypothetical protein
MAMENIIVALISLSGVVISAGVAYSVSLIQGRRSQKQLERQIKEVYTGKLYEKRIETYPELYSLASELGKHIFNNSVTSDHLRHTSSRLDSWDSRNSIFCSPSTLMKILALRKSFLKLSWDETHSPDVHFTRKLHEQLVDLEMTLRSEIGVFVAEGFHVPEEIKKLEIIMPK